MLADVEGREEDKDKHDKVVRSIDEYFIALKPPQDFSPSSQDNAVKNINLSFYKICAALEEAGVNNPKELSVFEFNVKLDHFYNKKKQN